MKAVALLPGQYAYEIPQHPPVVKAIDREGAVDVGRSGGACVHSFMFLFLQNIRYTSSDHRVPVAAARVPARRFGGAGYSIKC